MFIWVFIYNIFIELNDEIWKLLGTLIIMINSDIGYDRSVDFDSIWFASYVTSWGRYQLKILWYIWSRHLDTKELHAPTSIFIYLNSAVARKASDIFKPVAVSDLFQLDI